jgi:deoxyribodipyrimidine photo-lyase
MAKYTIFIFRRDFRLYDNSGFIYAMQNYDNIILMFIFTPEQITSKNKYRSASAVNFMIESLDALNLEIKARNKSSQLLFFYGTNIDILNKFRTSVDTVIFNMDYTPYAIKRDTAIKKWCDENDIKCVMVEDYLLKPIGTFNKNNGEPYTIYTPFKNNAFKIITKYKFFDLNKLDFSKLVPAKDNDKATVLDIDQFKLETNMDSPNKGGRPSALKILKDINNKHKNYDATRNTPIIDTTQLGAYIKFGCVSIREVYEKIDKKNKSLLAQLLWREFYYYIAYYFPNVLKQQNYNEKYNKIKWIYDKKNYMSWCNGTTGYPIVDAGMVQLNSTGFMHNRLRLITANFLNRMLGMNWIYGEIYFAKMLTDYDPAVNNGNWQWIASTGVDPKPYYQRLFNPWLQSKKFDTDALYIKKWLPQLQDIPANELHSWDAFCDNYDLKKIHYCKPIVDYKLARQTSIKQYKNI